MQGETSRRFVDSFTSDPAGWELVQGMMSHWAERSAEARVAEGVAVMWRLVTERLGLAVTLAEVQYSYCSTVQYSTVQYSEFPPDLL